MVNAASLCPQGEERRLTQVQENFMARFLKNRSAVLGKAPGELVFVGDRKVEESTVKLIEYTDETLKESEIPRIEEVFSAREKPPVSWININGLHDMDLIRETGKGFGLHPLTLEDILNTGQRPKMEEYDSYLFMTLKMMKYDEDKRMVTSEQLALVQGDTWLLTFQERPGDVFEPVRERIRKKRGRVRTSSADYLAYALLDTIIDNYIYIIERLGEQIEDNEELILSGPDKDSLSRINNFKRELNYLRKSIRPAREFILQMSRLDSDLLGDEIFPFIKDLLDLATQASETIEVYREMLSDQLDIYNTMVGNRLNEIMKVLTIFSAIFIPLTFIAGIYGTNFEYLPELGFRYAYYVFWGVLLLVAVLMLRFFKKKKWL